MKTGQDTRENHKTVQGYKWVTLVLVACMVAGLVWTNVSSNPQPSNRMDIQKTDLANDDTAYDTAYEGEDALSDVNVVDEDLEEAIETAEDRRKRKFGYYTRVLLRRPSNKLCKFRRFRFSRRCAVDLRLRVFRGNFCWKFFDLKKVVKAMKKGRRGRRGRRRRCRVTMKYVWVNTQAGRLEFKTRVKLLVIRKSCRRGKKQLIFFVWQSGCRSKSPTVSPTSYPSTSPTPSPSMSPTQSPSLAPTQSPTPFCSTPYGIVTNLQVSNFDASGWTRCYYEPYSADTTITALTTACPDKGSGTTWFVGAIDSQAPDVIIVGAQVTRSLAVTTQSSTSTAQNVMTAGGATVYFYNLPNKSFGFSPQAAVSLSSCDVRDSSSKERLCWHMHGHVGGYRAGSIIRLNSDNRYYKVVYYRSTPC